MIKWNKIDDKKPELNKDIYIISEFQFGAHFKDIHKAIYTTNYSNPQPYFDLCDQSEDATDVEEQITYKITHWIYCEDFPFPS